MLSMLNLKPHNYYKNFMDNIYSKSLKIFRILVSSVEGRGGIGDSNISVV